MESKEQPKLSKHLKAAVNNLEKQIEKLRSQRDKEQQKMKDAKAAFEALDISISALFDNINALKKSSDKEESSAETLLEVTKNLK